MCSSTSVHVTRSTDSLENGSSSAEPRTTRALEHCAWANATVSRFGSIPTSRALGNRFRSSPRSMPALHPTSRIHFGSDGIHFHKSMGTPTYETRSRPIASSRSSLTLLLNAFSTRHDRPAEHRLGGGPSIRSCKHSLVHVGVDRLDLALPARHNPGWKMRAPPTSPTVAALTPSGEATSQ